LACDWLACDWLACDWLACDRLARCSSGPAATSGATRAGGASKACRVEFESSVFWLTGIQCRCGMAGWPAVRKARVVRLVVAAISG
jgi:hypothetical protein